MTEGKEILFTDSELTKIEHSLLEGTWEKRSSIDSKIQIVLKISEIKYSNYEKTKVNSLPDSKITGLLKINFLPKRGTKSCKYPEEYICSLDGYRIDSDVEISCRLKEGLNMDVAIYNIKFSTNDIIESGVINLKFKRYEIPTLDYSESKYKFIKVSVK